MAVDDPIFRSSATETMSGFCILPSPGFITSYPFLKEEDVIDGSMTIETTAPAWLHRTWAAKDGADNTMTCFYIPIGTASSGCYGVLDGAMPINQFPAGLKVCRYTINGGEPWDFVEETGDAFFRNAQVM
jgi:hypothetical protein